MKNYKGQSLVQLIILSAISFGIIMSALYSFGGNMAAIFDGKNPLKMFNSTRTAQYDNPNFLLSGVVIDLGGSTIRSPIEDILLGNIRGGRYGNGPFGKLIEKTQIMQEYARQILELSTEFDSGAPYTAYNTALMAYKAVIDNTLAKMIAPGVSELEIKLAIVNMTIKLDDSGALATGLKSALNTYLTSLDSTDMRVLIIGFYSNDLLNFAKSITYTIENSSYTEVLGASKLNTLTQDQSLVDKMYTDFSGYSDGQKTNYSNNIQIISNSNYSEIAPNTFNLAALCRALGGSGNPCVFSSESGTSFFDIPLGSNVFDNADWQNILNVPSSIYTRGMGNISVVTDDLGRFTNVLRQVYAAGQTNGGSECVFMPKFNTSTDHAFLKYSVKFDNDFDFVAGGSLPGLYGGTANDQGVTPDGTDKWSARWKWKENGWGTVQAYLPDQAGISIGIYGVELVADGVITFQRGVWTDLQQEIKLNTPGINDGVIRLWVNGTKVYEKTDIIFRTVDTLKIDGFFYSSFFAGPDSSYAPTTEQSADFANFHFSNNFIP